MLAITDLLYSHKTLWYNNIIIQYDNTYNNTFKLNLHTRNLHNGHKNKVISDKSTRVVVYKSYVKMLLVSVYNASSN